jgi:hypothetical protein
VCVYVCSIYACCFPLRTLINLILPNMAGLYVQTSWLSLYLNSVVLLIVENENSDGRKVLRTQFDKNFSFFYVELPDGSILSHLVEENEKFPAQFGREVTTWYLFCVLVQKCNFFSFLFPQKIEFTNSCNLHNTGVCPNIFPQDYLDECCASQPWEARGPSVHF